MAAKVYVGNLSWNTNDDTLRQVFSNYGNILDSIVMRDRETGRSRGFGFVTYGTDQEAQTAIASMNDQELDGRRVKVNLANARGGGGGGNPNAGGFGGFQQPSGGYNAYGGQFGGYQQQPQQGYPQGYGGFNPPAGGSQGYGQGMGGGQYPTYGGGGSGY